jgi:hypothetical protein
MKYRNANRAKNLIGLGLSIDKIVEATKLSRKEIEKLYD